MAASSTLSQQTSPANPGSAKLAFSLSLALESMCACSAATSKSRMALVLNAARSGSPVSGTA